MRALARNHLHRRNRGIVVALDLALGVSSFVLAVFLLHDIFDVRVGRFWEGHGFSRAARSS